MRTSAKKLRLTCASCSAVPKNLDLSLAMLLLVWSRPNIWMIQQEGQELPRIPNIFGQPTPTAGIMKSVLQTKVVHLPVAIADCTFLHHDQTTGKKAARCPGVKYSFLSLSLVCCTQREIMFAFWKIFIHLRQKKKKEQQPRPFTFK